MVNAWKNLSPKHRALLTGAVVAGLLATAYVLAREISSKEPEAFIAPPEAPGENDIVIDEKLYEWTPSGPTQTPQQ